MKRQFYLKSVILLLIFISNNHIFANENSNDSVYYRWIATKETKKEIGKLVRNGEKEKYVSQHTCGLPNIEYERSKFILTYKNESGKEVEVKDSLQAIKIYDSLNLYYKNSFNVIEASVIGPNECGCWIYSFQYKDKLTDLRKEKCIILTRNKQNNGKNIINK